MIIGFLGAGQMAQTLAPVWLRAGHRVLLANSRGPASLADLVATLGPAASAVTPPELPDAAAHREQAAIVAGGEAARGLRDQPGIHAEGGRIIRVQLSAGHRDTHLLSGRLEAQRGLRVILRQLVILTNHLLIRRLGTLHDHAEPLALYLAGDDPAAKAVVAGLIRDLGGVPVDTGRLVEGARRWAAGGVLSGHDHPLTGTEAEALLAGHG